MYYLYLMRFREMECFSKFWLDFASAKTSLSPQTKLCTNAQRWKDNWVSRNSVSHKKVHHYSNPYKKYL